MNAETTKGAGLNPARGARRRGRRRKRRAARLPERQDSPRPEVGRHFEPLDERILRNYVQAADVPEYCENRACRRFHLCMGKWPPAQRGKTLPCYDRHRDRLEPGLFRMLDEIKIYWFGRNY